MLPHSLDPLPRDKLPGHILRLVYRVECTPNRRDLRRAVTAVINRSNTMNADLTAVLVDDAHRLCSGIDSSAAPEAVG